MIQNAIIKGDCLDVMAEFEPMSVDMIITSPPYDNLRTYDGYSFPFEKIAVELVRIIREGRVIVWIVADATIRGSETCTSFRQALFFKELGMNLHDTMIFKKRNAIPQIYRKRYTNEFEYMFVFSKGKIKIHNPIEIPTLHGGLALKSSTYKNFSTGEQKRGKLAKPVKEKKLKGNIWEYVVGKKKIDQYAKKHPAPFPVALAYDHITSWTDRNEVVLDPMCGSGSACLAAKIAQRRYLGIEISEDYCRIAEERLENTTVLECDPDN